jgi:hypothetical protein
MPKVHDYSLGKQNGLGAPYIIMDYVDGLVATELQKQKGCKPDMFGTAEQDERFRRQMAAIQTELALCRFDQIGCLVYDEQSKEFGIGPELETGKGPWNSSLEYFKDAADHAWMTDMLDRFRHRVSENEVFYAPHYVQAADQFILHTSFWSVLSHQSRFWGSQSSGERKF